MGKIDLRTVIAPSGYARSSDFRVSENKLIRRPLEFFALQKIGVTVLKIGRSLDVFWRKRGMTFDTVILGQQRVTRVSRDIKWTLGSSPRVTEEERPRVTGERKCPRMTIGLIFFICTSMTAIAKAECVPTPDCVSIGYTATSCDGDFVRCPFDTSKLFCIPCDNDFKYTCVGIGYNGGEGSSCNGKYAGCVCSGSYKWDGGACVLTCDSTYKYTCSGTGYSGGSGVMCGDKYISCICSSGYYWSGGKCKPDCNVGMLYYADGTCSSGTYTGSQIVGIVVKKNELILGKPVEMQWGGYGTNVAGITNITNGTTAKADMNGKTNTAAIVSQFGSSNSNDYAGVYCYNYAPNGMTGSKGSWYLPAAGELCSYVFANKDAIYEIIRDLNWAYLDETYWSSTETSSYNAYQVEDGCDVYAQASKNSYNMVTCFLSIN